jgi:hypothetical protein
MYQEEVKPNPAILRKYVLAGELNSEWVVQLYNCPDYSPSDILLKREPVALAVYRPTGRIFIENSKNVYEYKYEGIRIKG